MRETALERENLVWALAAMCQFHRLPFEGNLVLRAFPPPYTIATLLHAAESLGFRAARARAAAADLTEGHLPCLAIVRPSAGGDAESPAACVLVVRVADGEVHCVAPGNPNPQTEPLEAFAARYTGVLVRFAPVTEAPVDHDARDPADGRGDRRGGEGGTPGYRTLVTLDTPYLESADGKRHLLQPGMQLTAEIHLGTRTVLEYVLSPVQKAVHEAGRER